MPYTCGSCHTTGYNPEGHQDDLPGIVGTWTEPGIRCEECHGPGSLHAETPRGFRMVVNRDAEQCGECHVRGAPEQVNAGGGFIQHHEQYEELFQSKHITLISINSISLTGNRHSRRMRARSASPTKIGSPSRHASIMHS